MIENILLKQVDRGGAVIIIQGGLKSVPLAPNFQRLFVKPKNRSDFPSLGKCFVLRIPE